MAKLRCDPDKLVAHIVTVERQEIDDPARLPQLKAALVIRDSRITTDGSPET
jgi:hypothetical protein